MLTVVVAGGIFTLPLYSGSTPTNTSINAALSAITTVLLLGDTGTLLHLQLTMEHMQMSYGKVMEQLVEL